MNKYENNQYMNYNPETLEPEQKYPINSKNFKIRNYGDSYFYPQNQFQDGLKEVIIFRENHKKYDIPNGSVWIYDKNKAYIPQILKEDVGCGITAYIIEPLEYTQNTAKDIVNIISAEQIKIGRGNHFIDFTNSHPLVQNGNMIILHSDFHFDNNIPKTFSEATDMIKTSEELRIKTIEKIINKMGIDGTFYKNWTHNAIEISDTDVTYRKGAISLNKTEKEGLLALNPYDGFYSYISDFNAYHGYMQHGTGKKLAGKIPINPTQIIKSNKVTGTLIDRENTPANVYDYYQKLDNFMTSFGLGHLTVGHIRPKLVINTD